MGFWGDVAGALTGGSATYHTYNLFGGADSSAAKMQMKTNPAANDYYKRRLEEDRDKVDGGAGDSQVELLGVATGAGQSYKVGRALGIEDNKYYEALMHTNPNALGNYSYRKMAENERGWEAIKKEDKARTAGMQLGAYTPPDLSNPDGAYALGRK